ncbi:MAG: hypothetical protein KF895_02950 [Parvibaculum sp.]|nr:hypothetical protein [Parvibaculum sp.]
MNEDDLAYALACAAELSGLPWSGAAPRAEFVDRDYLGHVGSDVDRSGNRVTNSNRMTGAYFWSNPHKEGKAYFSKMADKPVVAHEMTHFLQDMAGMDRGGTSKEGLAQRRVIEAQAYNVEELTPFECLTLFGGWKDSVKKRADAKRRAFDENAAPDGGALEVMP